MKFYETLQDFTFGFSTLTLLSTILRNLAPNSILDKLM